MEMESLLTFPLTILSGSISLHEDKNLERWFSSHGRGKALGVAIATWKDGKVVLVPPEEIEIPEEPEAITGQD